MNEVGAVLNVDSQSQGPETGVAVCNTLRLSRDASEHENRGLIRREPT
jgi:hypothetical protein